MLQDKKKIIIIGVVVLFVALVFLLMPKNSGKSVAESSVDPGISMMEQPQPEQPSAAEKVEAEQKEAASPSQAQEADTTPKEDNSLAEQFAAIIDPALIGTWKGLLSSEAMEPEYWVFTFSEDGTYTYAGRRDAYSDELIYESGTYSTVYNPDDVHENASLILVCDGESKTIDFFLAGKNLDHLSLDISGHPSYQKEG